MDFTTINPATGQKIKSYNFETESVVLGKVNLAHNAYQKWREVSVKERVALLTKIADRLHENREKFADIITNEMGKVKKEALAEIDKCRSMVLYYIENGEDFLANIKIEADGKDHQVVREPLGVIFSIMPWNFPFWQALRFAIPAILAGNSLILKHSNQVPESAFAIEELFGGAGFPPHLFQTIIIGHQTTESLLKHPLIKGISFTGSTEVGKRVASFVAGTFKKVVLELGGSDPFIVFSDADIEKAAEHAAIGRLINAGQSCIAAKRFIVHESIVDKFSHLLAEKMDQRVIGDPKETSSDIGPLVSMKAVKDLEGMVHDALTKGAKLFYKKTLKDLSGLYYPPTILTEVKQGMRVFKEETFGPVAPIITFKTDQEALLLANSSPFGLGASIWGGQTEKLEKFALQIESGVVFINAFVRSDPRLPFGGVKESGVGRELGSWGLYEFTSIKAVNIY